MKKAIHSFFIFTAVMFVCTCGTHTSHAQMNALTQAQQGLAGITVASIELSPKFPTPGSAVKATLNAPTIELDTSLVTWVVNGTVVQKEYSNDSYEFTVGKVGDVYSIVVIAEDSRGTTVKAEKKLYVSDIALVWEGRTYTPPFYKGRALQSLGSEVAFTVFPSVLDEKGRLYNASELSYIWSINYDSSPVVSGRGKSAVVLKNDQPYQDFVVNLQVKDPKGVVRTVKKVIIPATQPKVVLYEDSPLVGIHYPKAITGTLGVYEREVSVVAEPYYISAPTRTSQELSYEWTVDGSTFTNPGTLTFATEKNSLSGESMVNVVIKNTAYWLQNARANFTVLFGQRDLWAESFGTNSL